MTDKEFWDFVFVAKFEQFGSVDSAKKEADVAVCERRESHMRLLVR